jgi:hypothetical protein
LKGEERMKIYFKPKDGYMLMLDTNAKQIKMIDSFVEDKIMREHHEGSRKHILYVTDHDCVMISNAFKKQGYEWSYAV